jgi:hypothetical protein
MAPGGHREAPDRWHTKRELGARQWFVQICESKKGSPAEEGLPFNWACNSTAAA